MDALANRRGINIRYGDKPRPRHYGGTVYCRQVSESTAQQYAGALSAFLRVVPASVFRRVNLRHISLCRELGRPSGGRLNGIVDWTQKTLLVSVGAGPAMPGRVRRVEGTLHHELFHEIDGRLLGPEAIADRHWSALNAPDFFYPAPPKTPRREGFVSRYAMTDPQEDKAETYEEMVVYPDRVYSEVNRGNRVLSAKVKTICQRLRLYDDALGASFWHEVAQQRPAARTLCDG